MLTCAMHCTFQLLPSNMILISDKNLAHNLITPDLQESEAEIAKGNVRVLDLNLQVMARR